MANKNIVAQLEKNKIEVEKKQEEIKQLKNKERKILSMQRKAEQKIRTRRLIERGQFWNVSIHLSYPYQMMN